MSFFDFFRPFLLKNLLVLFVDFLIVSAGFLILLADAIRKSASSLIVSARRRVGLFALSLSCADLWPSWEGKTGNFVDVFSPRMSTNKAKEHESVLVLGRVGPVGLVRELSQQS